MEKKKVGLKPFFSLILSTGIPKLALTVGLTAGVLTTLAGLVVPLLTKNLVDGFSVASLSVPIMIAIGVAFILQAVIDGVSIYLLSYVGQKVVARLRERMWTKLIRLPVSHFDKESSGETVSRVVNDTGIVRELISQHFPQFITGYHFDYRCGYYFTRDGLENDAHYVNFCANYSGHHDSTRQQNGENLTWIAR